jgi:hypothetical protein
MDIEQKSDEFLNELETTFTIQEVEQRLEMGLYCCQGGDFGFGFNSDTCCGYKPD